MKLIPVTKAVGVVLSHDITEIVTGRFKGPAYKRGHVIRQEDVSGLREFGKYTSPHWISQQVGCMKMMLRTGLQQLPPVRVLR